MLIVWIFRECYQGFFTKQESVFEDKEERVIDSFVVSNISFLFCTSKDEDSKLNLNLCGE